MPTAGGPPPRQRTFRPQARDTFREGRERAGGSLPEQPPTHQREPAHPSLAASASSTVASAASYVRSLGIFKRADEHAYSLMDDDSSGDEFQALPPPPAMHNSRPVSRPVSRGYDTARRPSPFHAPPLTPLTLEADSSAYILSRAIAEEIRHLLPARLQLVDAWRLVFGLERDGASLTTLYERCASEAARAGYVLAVRDAAGGSFGAYLSDPPQPSKGHYYGTGECFLWKAQILKDGMLALPPPPSAAEQPERTTTIEAQPDGPASPGASPLSPGASLRFKAFPYSGANDYCIFCEAGFLSVGGGDGRYGLWLDAALERGVSGRSVTFGNEVLSEEGEAGAAALAAAAAKRAGGGGGGSGPGRPAASLPSAAPLAGAGPPFEVIGVEVWQVAA